jgi:hypothetical protein
MDLLPGWVFNHEKKPSLNRHLMPENQGHEMLVTCWCCPTVETTERSSLVKHRVPEII